MKVMEQAGAIQAMDDAAPGGTAHQQTYEQLRNLITGGVIGAGERLDERRLATLLGVSRTPIREAVGRLASDGIVEHRPYQGNFVRGLRPGEVRDLFEVRRELEGLAARLAASRILPESLIELEDITVRCKAAYDAHEWEEFERLDGEFHRLIVMSAGNDTLVQSLEKLTMKIQLVRHRANTVSGLALRTIYERDAVLMALQRGDGESAANFMRLHITGVQEAALAEMKRAADEAPAVVVGKEAKGGRAR